MKELLDYFKVMVCDENKIKDTLNLDLVKYGIILNFTPDKSQEKFLIENYTIDSIRTLFSVNEVEQLSLEEKIAKQILHYFSVYFFNAPNLLLNVEGIKDPLNFVKIKGVTKSELNELVTDVLYSNKPLKNTDQFMKIIKDYDIQYDWNKIKNNELKIILFDEKKNKFNNGDDVVRYVVFKCTDKGMLIKSKEVLLEVVRNSYKISVDLLENHKEVLSNVFNRHKKIILSLKKNKNLKSVINKISHMSKKTHVPLVMSKNKTFIQDAIQALKNLDTFDFSVLNTFSIRDKFKYLNLLRYKMYNFDEDMFIIRNGKTWVEKNRPSFSVAILKKIETSVLMSLSKDLEYLREKNIILPDNIDYGLPVSSKQTVGNVPFGTTVNVQGERISSGIYWKNEWGAYDLDLSSVDKNGNRVGWGMYSGYSKDADVKFSGDVVSANPDAMEFITSKETSHILSVNIFNGMVNSKAEVVVGSKSKRRWIESFDLREKIELPSKGMCIGFVDGKTYTAFLGRLNNNRSNFNQNANIIKKGKAFYWTVKKLFDELGIEYNKNKDNIDYDLSYDGFSYDKLEKVFEK